MRYTSTIPMIAVMAMMALSGSSARPTASDEVTTEKGGRLHVGDRLYLKGNKHLDMENTAEAYGHNKLMSSWRGFLGNHEIKAGTDIMRASQAWDGMKQIDVVTPPLPGA